MLPIKSEMDCIPSDCLFWLLLVKDSRQHATWNVTWKVLVTNQVYAIKDILAWGKETFWRLRTGPPLLNIFRWIYGVMQLKDLEYRLGHWVSFWLSIKFSDCRTCKKPRKSAATPRITSAWSNVNEVKSRSYLHSYPECPPSKGVSLVIPQFSNAIRLMTQSSVA